MKMIWCAETATKAYVDTVKSRGQCRENSGAPEYISATAGGWKASLIVEAWSNTGSGSANIGNSIGLAIAARHAGGRHVCIVANEKARQEYICAMQISTSTRATTAGSPAAAAAARVPYSLPEVMVGEAEELMERLNGVDFLVVDGGREDHGRVVSHAKFGHLVLLVSQNAGSGHNNNKMGFLSGGFRWNRVLDGREVNVVRSAFLPIGNGLDVAYVAGETSSSSWKSGRPKGWIRHIDQQSSGFRRR